MQRLFHGLLNKSCDNICAVLIAWQAPSSLFWNGVLGLSQGGCAFDYLAQPKQCCRSPKWDYYRVPVPSNRILPGLKTRWTPPHRPPPLLCSVLEQKSRLASMLIYSLCFVLSREGWQLLQSHRSCRLLLTCMSVNQFPPRSRESSFKMDMQIKEQIERGTPPTAPLFSQAPTPLSPSPTRAQMTKAIHQQRPSALFVLARVEVRRFAGSHISIIAFLLVERHLLCFSFLFFLDGERCDISKQAGGVGSRASACVHLSHNWPFFCVFSSTPIPQ